MYLSSSDGCVYRVNLLKTQSEGDLYDEGADEIGDNLDEGDEIADQEEPARNEPSKIGNSAKGI